MILGTTASLAIIFLIGSLFTSERQTTQTRRGY